MSQIDDVEAIHDFMLQTPSKTPAAETIRTSFLSWYEKAGFYDKNLSSTWFDEARTRRNQFNIANAVTVSESAAVQKVLATGLTAEQMQGKSRPKVDVKTGKVGSQIHDTVLSASGAPVLTRVLKKGMNGDDVKTWQSFLALTPPTGYFDALTDTKTRAFQKAQHLTADGAVGKMTWAKAFPIVADANLAPSSTSDAFAPPSQSPNFAPTAGPATSFAPAPGAPKQAPKQSSAGPTAQTAPTKPFEVVKAGLDPSKWSTGAKVVGALAALGLAGGAIMKHSEKPSAVSRATDDYRRKHSGYR